MSRQCIFAGVLRATPYAQQESKELGEGDELLKRLIGEEYTHRNVSMTLHHR